MRKIVIAGGTGFLGTCLARHFTDQGAQVIVLTRGHNRRVGPVQYLNWDGKKQGAWRASLEGADAVINLNGKSVDCRYTEKNKALIYATRLDATAAIGEAILTCTNPPKIWINAASATIYRHALDKDMDEYTGEIGEGFSVDVCKKWEALFNGVEVAKTRKVLIRTGIVLGKNGGPLRPLRVLARLGMGGRQAAGNQYFSWLHEADFVNAIEYIIGHSAMNGAYNLTAPQPIPNRDVMRALRSAIGMPFGLPLPKSLLELGALIIGTETELVLKSRRVVPRRLLEAGYVFKFSDIESTLIDLCQR